jgi:hypothetical protein
MNHIPDLPGAPHNLDERLRRRKAHLMTEIASSPNPARPRRRRLVASASAVCLLLGGGAAVAHASGSGVFRQDNGQYAVNGDALRPEYQGRILTEEELESLQSKGRATISANNIDLACRGVVRYFDTEEEWAAYTSEYDSTFRSRNPTQNPCAPEDNPGQVAG